MYTYLLKRFFSVVFFFLKPSQPNIYILYIYFFATENDEFACLTLGLFIEKND